MELQLAANVRKEKGKELKNLRKKEIIPGIVYGKYIDAPMNISFDKQEFLKVYKAGGYSTPITLKGDGVDQLVLLHDIQVDPVTDYVLHVDFITLKKGQKVETEVAIVVEGLAPVEKLGLGKVQLVKDAVEIEALPKDLPHDIKVDVSGLETINDVIFVKDLAVDKGVTLLGDLEQPVVTVLELVEESEEETTEEATAETGETPAAAEGAEEKTAE